MMHDVAGGLEELKTFCICARCRNTLKSRPDTDGDGVLVEIVEPCVRCCSRIATLHPRPPAPAPPPATPRAQFVAAVARIGVRLCACGCGHGVQVAGAFRQGHSFRTPEGRAKMSETLRSVRALAIAERGKCTKGACKNPVRAGGTTFCGRHDR